LIKLVYRVPDPCKSLKHEDPHFGIYKLETTNVIQEPVATLLWCEYSGTQVTGVLKVQTLQIDAFEA
jgi:hypothetical protein